MSTAEYEDRIRAAWYGQIAGTLMGFAFEHRAAAALLESGHETEHIGPVTLGCGRERSRQGGSPHLVQGDPGPCAGAPETLPGCMWG